MTSNNYPTFATRYQPQPAAAPNARAAPAGVQDVNYPTEPSPQASNPWSMVAGAQQAMPQEAQPAPLTEQAPMAAAPQQSPWSFKGK